MKANVEFVPLNRVAVTAFVICAGAGSIVAALLKQPSAADCWRRDRRLSAFRDQSGAASGRKWRCCGWAATLDCEGRGWFHVVPVFETVSHYIDQRVRVHSVTAESTLTRDTVPVNVDAIVFWMVWNAEKAILEVENFIEAVNMSAQTALRESIGRHELAQMITEREVMGRELQQILDEKTNPWGITVQSVEIRDVRIPQSLEDAMSQQAQAERERQARVILGHAEVQVSEQFAEASRVYNDNPGALHLRAMNMLYEAIKERGSMVIVPSSAVETMGLGGTLATAAIGKQQ